MTEIDEDSTHGQPDDTSNIVHLEKKPTRRPGKKFRKVKVLEADDGQFYYVAVDRKGEPLYTSETFTKRNDAIRAARREHEGRSENFDYILEYQTAKGNTVKETL